MQSITSVPPAFTTETHVKAKLKILHLVDSEANADLVHMAIKNSLIDAEVLVVSNKEDFEKAIHKFSFDLILSDHSLPCFSAIEAFEIFKYSNLRIPFILVTDSVSEEFAVRAIKSGVDDYILKDNLTRLPSAINNALAFYKLERENQTLKKTNEQLMFSQEELKKRTQELEHSNKELEQFAYIVSHDLQEPLRMVGSHLQLIESRYKDKLDKEADEFLHYAVDGANRMKQLINDLLNYSRLNRRAEPTMVDLNQVIDNVRQNLSESTKETNVVLTASELPVIQAQQTQMIQLFQNLISNAIKFRRNEIETVIQVQAEKRNAQWIFSVSDNGIGIDHEYSDGVFVIFKRLHTRGKYSGTGIGLAVAKRIVERHGGKIWFESVIGKGTTFFFTLTP